MEKIYEIVRIKQEVMETMENRYVVRSPEDVVKHAYDLIGEDDREVVLVMVLNTKNHVVAVHRCHVGSINSSIVHPREIFKAPILFNEIIKENGASIIVVHQHPSGDSSASPEDINSAKRLQKSGGILGIQLLDFCILGEKTEGRVKFTSLKEKGYL